MALFCLLVIYSVVIFFCGDFLYYLSNQNSLKQKLQLVFIFQLLTFFFFPFIFFYINYLVFYLFAIVVLVWSNFFASVVCPCQ